LSNPSPDDVKSVQIKTGISDGIFTEVVEGLKDGDVLLTGLQLSTASDASKPTNPFAGSRSRFGPGPPGPPGR
jgi:HlyD family secretion protein